MNQLNEKYYQLEQKDKAADIYIFGDITSWPWLESDVSAYNLSKEIAGLDVDAITIHINSYGGEVAEGLAIYNELKNHKAKITTICSGFACSIASVIFMAGDERIMNESSLLMIHNAWTRVSGNAEALRKQAEDLEIITQASIKAYMTGATITEDKVKELMDNESWILPADAVSWGFATAIESAGEEDKPSQSVRKKVFEKMAQEESQEKTIEEIVKETIVQLKNQIEPKEPTKSLEETLAGFFM